MKYTIQTAQQLLNKDVMTTESKPSSCNAEKTVLDITSPASRTWFGVLKNVESKTQDFPIAIFVYENGLSFDVANSQSLAALVDQGIEFGQQYQGRI